MGLLDDILSTLTGGGSLPEAVRKRSRRPLACVDEGELVIAEGAPARAF